MKKTGEDASKFNLFLTDVYDFIPQKTPRNFWFSGVSRGVINGKNSQ